MEGPSQGFEVFFGLLHALGSLNGILLCLAAFAVVVGVVYWRRKR